ncbi:hypothetical protein CDD81_3971 [Ophiocordyceps australis]|uniref:Uncharacterized protein n=1 Tax=Ophiocordyceps australis TaxID=1399860 RepID=A0A2C5XUB6_9HYPO|nr:hypothetical protein CDD81_3971 [Ophiocordyceps australis]
MSADTRPISPSRFAAAIKDLSPSTLRLKLLEIRNSIAHLDYSNAQMLPFAQPSSPSTLPDQDCIDAIAENQGVVQHMMQRVELIRAEVEARSLAWQEFAELAPSRASAEEEQEGGEERHAAWEDGTFETGMIRGGQVRFDGREGVAGGSLSDEELRRVVERQLREWQEGDESSEANGHDAGLHL